MLTPNEVRDKKHNNKLRAAFQLSPTLTNSMVKKLDSELYIEVLKEIASGSIDPKSLAIAALEKEE